jgi:hypothetical protein
VGVAVRIGVGVCASVGIDVTLGRGVAAGGLEVEVGERAIAVGSTVGSVAGADSSGDAGGEAEHATRKDRPRSRRQMTRIRGEERR